MSFRKASAAERNYRPGIIFFSLLIFSISYSTILLSQTYYFDTYGPADAASSKVYAILQDDMHRIWLGTPGGISVFDGKMIQNFGMEDSMANQGVRTIFQDSRKTIWFGHLEGGISRFKHGRFSVFNSLDSIIASDITSIFEDSLKRIWITTEGSGAFLLPKPYESPEVFIQFLGRNNLSDRVYGYCLARDRSIYLITDAGIRKYSENDTSFVVFHPEGLTSYFSIITMFQDGQDNFWFGTYHGGLYKYESDNDTVISYDIRDGLSSNWISAITQDHKGNMWIGTFGGGITRINDAGFKVFNERNGLKAERIFAIREDVEGNMLIGSYNNGFLIFKGAVIEHYGETEGLRNKEVYAIARDRDKNFWIGTNNGIAVFTNRLEKPLRYFTEVNNPLLDNQVSSDLKIRFLEYDRQNTLWIGTEDQGVLFIQKLAGKIQEAFLINRWFSGTVYRVSALETDQYNNLWIGTSDGLLRYNINTTEIQRLNNAAGLIGNDISTVYCDTKDHIWVGAYSKDGVSRISDNQRIENFHLGRMITPSCFIEDKSGQIWMGTKGDGIFRIEDQKITEQGEINAGLLSLTINTLNVDDENCLYIGTNTGLNILDQENGQIRTYNQKNGFTGIEINPSASFYDQEGNIWFGTNLGINRYNITEADIDIKPPLIYLTSLSVNQKIREINSRMRFRSYENQISLTYKSICVTNSDAVRYRYMLEGLDDTWQEATIQNAITYQSLPPGRYNFKVIARNSDGIWSSEPANLQFTIRDPFYKQWYVIVSAVIIILAIFWLYVKARERNLIREKKILEGKVKERTLQLEEANFELADKNKNITDSIRYALRIQMSILPPEIPFPNMFVLFKPKDIVSGDFYWLTKIGKKEIVAAIDCTGHGVPGAFMSFIGYSSLNEVVKEKKITRPSLILDNLNDAVVTSLNLKGDEAIKDGMDLAVISYDSSNHELEYAGAYNPLYLIRKGELTEYKADRFAIGKSSEVLKIFTNHVIQIQPGDTIYIFSDGYADQFGGPDDKKFKPWRMKELFLGMCDKRMEEQKRILEETIEKWRGDVPQVDDILIIGRKF